MVPRRMTVTALGLLLAAVTLVVGGAIGAAVATPRTNGGWNSGRDHVEVGATLGKDGLSAKGHTVVDVGSPGGKGASPRSGPTVPAPASLAGTGRTEPGPAEARAPTVPTAAAVAVPDAPPSTVVAAPAPAPEPAAPSVPPAPVASVTPAAPAPDVTASSSTPRSAPRAAVDAIVAHAPASLAAVALLLAAALLFLVVQPALDRHDKRLVLGGVDDAPARFR